MLCQLSYSRVGLIVERSKGYHISHGLGKSLPDSRGCVLAGDAGMDRRRAPATWGKAS
jgi:hypothetical protein